MTSNGTDPKHSKPSRPRKLRLNLPASVTLKLARAGILCDPVVTVEYQSVARRHVVRGVESGGAVPTFGHYVLFCDTNGEPMPWVQPLHALIPNGRHAVIVSAALVSIEIFRAEQTYQLLVARHEPEKVANGGGVRVRSSAVFQGEGYLSLELWGRDRAAAGKITPDFFTRSGERRALPAEFVSAIMAATQGAAVPDCTAAVYACPPSVRVDAEAPAVLATQDSVAAEAGAASSFGYLFCS